MSAPAEQTPPARRKWPRLVLLLALVLAGAGGAWWYFRPKPPPAPEPPAVDLSRAEPDVARAITAALEEVRARPRDAAAWGKLGMLLRAHDFDTECLVAFRTAAELDPQDYRWPYLEGLTRVLDEPGAGLECLRRAAEVAPPDRPQPRLRSGEIMLERGDTDGAAAMAEAVLKTSPNNTRAQLLLARVAATRRDWDAVLSRTAACEHDPDCRRGVALLRGEAFAVRGERERAEAAFRAAADLPEDAWPDPAVAEVQATRVGSSALISQAVALLERGRAAEAVEVLTAAARKAPDKPEPALRLGQALIRAGEFHEALRVTQDFTARFPHSVEGWFNLGVARFQTGDTKGAADAFRQTIKRKPDYALAHFNLGHCHRKLGDRVAAKAAFEEALRCRPGHEPSRQALAELEAEKK